MLALQNLKAKAWTFEAKAWTFEAKAWTFEAKATGREAKAIKYTARTEVNICSPCDILSR